MQGLAGPPHLGGGWGVAPSPAAPPPVAPSPPESEPWLETTVRSVDDFVAEPPLILPPARIISIGPAPSPEPLQRSPEVNPYAVPDDEQTLLDHRADFDQPEITQLMAEEEPPRALARLPSAHMVASVVAVTTSPPPDPFRRDLRDPRLVLLTEPDSARAASFRLLRDNILSAQSPRIILVSSGAVNEGKTTCAINLALALHERPATRVLLLDGNFFAPSLGEIFHIDASTPPAPAMNAPWLLPYLVAEIMRGFHVAALVQPPGGPAPLFNSRWFDMALNHLSGAGYDHVIVDAAALDGSAPVLQMVGAADGTLLTVRSGGSTARDFRRAAEHIPKGRKLGVTLMDGE
jgi:Mrp family chromosome partitioning ATPase